MNPSQALQELPARIRQAENDLWEHRAQLERVRLQMRNHEAEVALRVAGAVDAAGKKVHGNQDARDGATRERLAGDPGFTDLRRSLDEKSGTIAKIEATLGYWRDVQRNARVLLLARNPIESFLDIEDLGAVAKPASPGGA